MKRPEGARNPLSALLKAVDTMQLGVTITDIERRILYTNIAEASMHGYEQEELIGRDITIFIPSEMRKPMPEAQIRKLRRWKRESINRRKDGTLFPVRLISDMISDGEGEPVGVVTICEDITEQKRLEEALSRSYRELEERVAERTGQLKRLADQRKRLLELSQSVLATLDLDRVVKRILLTLREVVSYDICGIYWLNGESGVLRPAVLVGRGVDNPGWEIPAGTGIAGSVVRSRHGELVNNAHKDPRSVYPPEYSPSQEHLICIPILAKGETKGVFVVIRNSDPPFTDEEMELCHVYVSYGTIAIENARLFEEIRASERKYRTLFEDTQDTVFISTPDGRFLDVNPAGLRMLGYSRLADVADVNIARDHFARSTDRVPYQESLARDGFVKNYELELKRKDGSTLTVLETTNAVRNSDGEVIEYRGIMRDITELRRAQQKEAMLQDKLRRSEAMEKMGKLVAGVAHEVRNPLTSILALTEVLERDFGTDPRYHQFLSGIRSQVERLSTLMKDLLELGKPVNTSRMKAGSVRQLCESTVNLWTHTDESRIGRVALVLPPSEIPDLLMDSQRIQQVLMNLLDNAAQHSPEDRRIRLVLEDGADAVRMRVEDEGAGIPGQNFSRLFEPFFTTRRGGVGLGLSLVKHFVELHGGQVSAWNNKPNPGCTFEVTLPRAQEESP